MAAIRMTAEEFLEEPFPWKFARLGEEELLKVAVKYGVKINEGMSKKEIQLKIYQDYLWDEYEYTEDDYKEIENEEIRLKLTEKYGEDS